MVRSLLVVPAVLGVALGCACGSSTSPTVPPTTAATAAPTATATPTAPPAATTGALSGTWTGQYSGTYSGTFTLTWQEAGSTLTGSIQLSNPPKTFGITGNVNGSAITFGAVGVATYSGTISGNTMSGQYQLPTANGNAGSGSWNASKSS